MAAKRHALQCDYHAELIQQIKQQNDLTFASICKV